MHEYATSISIFVALASAMLVRLYMGKKATQRSIRMPAFQQKTCQKCGRYSAAGNQLRRCGSCLAVKYCSSACQTEDWASHKPFCKNVGAARLKPLMFAANTGDVATVKRLLKSGAKVDGRGVFGDGGWVFSNNDEAPMLRTPLFAAAAAGHAAVIAVLLKAGAKINRTTARGFTPLFLAAQEGHRAAVSVLIGAGAEVDIVTDKQCTPLLIAAQEGHRAVVALLIEAGGNINHTRDDECSPLILAAQHDHRAVLAVLIKAGADINQAKDNGCTPLFMAAQENYKTVLATLLKAGADVNPGMDNGCSLGTLLQRMGMRRWWWRF